MATQTPIQRQAAAKRAAATRKRNDAKRSATATKASGRRTRGAASGAARNARSNARTTARAAGTTTASAAGTAAKAANAAGTRLSAAARNAQRAVLIPVGALAVAGEAMRRTAETYADSRRRARQFDRFERRGAKALDWGQRSVARRTR
jgi:hypothetical protein